MLLHRLLIDDREKDPSPQEQLRGVGENGGHAAIQRLEVGDYQWTTEPDKPGEEWATWVGERKSIKDLLASLPPQSDRLTRFFENTGGWEPAPSTHRFLLLEGDQFRFSSWGEREWTPEALDNLLVSLQEKGIVIVRSRGGAETPKRLVSLWARSGRPDRGTSILKPSPATASDRFFDRADREAVAFLMGLPSLGEGRVVETLKALDTPAAVLTAFLAGDPKMFTTVNGIGSGIVRSVNTFLHRKFTA